MPSQEGPGSLQPENEHSGGHPGDQQARAVFVLAGVPFLPTMLSRRRHWRGCKRNISAEIQCLTSLSMASCRPLMTGFLLHNFHAGPGTASHFSLDSPAFPVACPQGLVHQMICSGSCCGNW